MTAPRQKSFMTAKIYRPTNICHIRFQVNIYKWFVINKLRNIIQAFPVLLTLSFKTSQKSTALVLQTVAMTPNSM